MKNKKILSMLTAGLVFSSIFAVSVSSYAAETTNESENVLKLKSPAETYEEQGEKLYKEGKFEEAIIPLEKAAKEAKTNAVYWSNCGMAYYQVGKFKSAKSCFEQSIDLQKSSATPEFEPYYFYALTEMQLAFRESDVGKRSDRWWRAEQKLEVAERIAPSNCHVQMAMGWMYHHKGNDWSIIRSNPRFITMDSSVTEATFYEKAYNHFRRAVELASNDEENQATQGALSNFVNAHPGYGFESSTAKQSGVMPGPQTGAAVITPETLKVEAAQMQQWMQAGRIKAYNAGAGFEWWDEKSKADFEALPFSDDIEEVASHVYRVIWDTAFPETVSYVVIVPRHERILGAYGEEDTVFDSLRLVEIASTEEQETGWRMTPLTQMTDKMYIKDGRTTRIYHLDPDWKGFDWRWIQEHEEEVKEQESSPFISMDESPNYTFEGTSELNRIVLRGHNGVMGVMDVLPGITIPPLPRHE